MTFAQFERAISKKARRAIYAEIDPAGTFRAKVDGVYFTGRADSANITVKCPARAGYKNAPRVFVWEGAAI